MSEFHERGPVVAGLLIFIGCWIYAIATYGWFWGVGLAWLPSAFIALFAWFLIAALWPTSFGDWLIASMVGAGLVVVAVLIFLAQNGLLPSNSRSRS